MKITELKTLILESPGREYVFVKVMTDEGIHGWGEATLEMKQGTVAAAIHDLEGFVLGEDPTRIEFLWQRMYRQGFWRGGVAILSGISAIEMALWDITGKAYNQPVYKLLGGACRDFIPCYTHTGDPARAQELMAEGWRAFKSGPKTPSKTIDEREIVRETAKAFEAMRVACGPDVELMCDCHGRFRPAVAVKLGRALEPYDLLFFEEPIPPDNPLALKNVRAAGLKMDLATGERAFLRWGYRELIENQLIDVIQPDVTHDGGILETRKIAAMAETYNIVVAPHNPNGPVATAATVQLAAAIPNLLILEYAISPTRDACQLGEPIRAVNGRVELPTKPGLGIELDEEYITRNAFTGIKLWPSYRFADGSIADV
jgi:galactonate dehydratase